MKSNQTLSVLCVALGFVGFLCQGNVKALQTNGLTLADIEAFTNDESDPETSGGSTTPPDPWNYAPNRYIKATPHTEKVTCKYTGSIGYSNGTITGEFSKGNVYLVSWELKNCDGEQKGAWCDQRQVGAFLKNVELV